jgi:glucokinase
MTWACVIDIGGTSFRAGLADERGRFRKLLVRRDTPSFLNCPGGEAAIGRALVAAIVAAYASASAVHACPVLAIGFPGPVSSSGRIAQSSVIFGDVLNAPFPLRARLKRAFAGQPARPRRILITNDMTASTWRYAQRGHDPFCLITVSSGVGNKIFANGRVLIGANGLAGEMGHHAAILEGYEIPCTCGTGVNHIGMISSGRGVEFFARHFAAKHGAWSRLYRASPLWTLSSGRPDAIQNRDVAVAADRADPFARAVLDFCVQPLADAIGLQALSLYIRRFILVGGFAMNCTYYRDALARQVIRRGIYNHSPGQIDRMIIRGIRDDYQVLAGLGVMVRDGVDPDGAPGG